MTRLAAPFLMAMFAIVFLVPVTEADAKERPEITRHEVRLLEGAASVTVQWQSPNPVLRVRVIVGKEQKEIKVDEYDNKRNRDGYWGEASLTLSVSYTVSTSSGASQLHNPYQAYGQYPPPGYQPYGQYPPHGAQQPSTTASDSVPYEIVVEDDLRQRSEPVTGSVRPVGARSRTASDDDWGKEHLKTQIPPPGAPPPPPPPGQTVGGMVDQVIGFVQGNPPQGQQVGQLPPGAGSASTPLELKNDGFTPGAGIFPFGGTAPGDEVAAVLGPVNRPFRAAKVNFICGGSAGTGTFTLKVHQETGRPEPGMLLFSETYAVQSSDQQFQEIDLSTSNISLPPESIRVSIAYQQAGLPGIAFDGVGTSVPGKNWVFRNSAWTDAANAGARGNAIIRVTIVNQ